MQPQPTPAVGSDASDSDGGAELLILIIGAIGGAFMLGGCAAYVLTKMLHKPAAPPAQEVPAHALAHVLTDVETVSVSSVQMAEVPRKVMSL